MSKENNGWISIKDQMPSLRFHGGYWRSESILCYGKESLDDENHIFIGNCVSGNCFYSDSGYVYQVLFWQPLPEPPTERKND